MRYPRLAIFISLVLSTLTLSAQRFTVDRSFASTEVDTSSIQNIHIPPIANAPFSAMVLINTNSSLHSYERVARDSAGRVFEEVRSLAGSFIAGGNAVGDFSGEPLIEPWITDLVYIDPVLHTAYDCKRKGHRCLALSYEDMAAPRLDARTDPTFGATVYSMGEKEIDGLQAIGSFQQLPNPPVDQNNRPLS